MTRVIRSELDRLVNRRTLAAVAAATVLFAIVASLAVFSSARDAGARSRRTGTTIAALTEAGGATEAFAVAASFAGFLAFVTVIALVSAEFSGGTFRALLLRHPHRVQVIAGKLTGILVVMAVAVAMAEVATAVASVVVASVRDVDTSQWFTVDGAVAGVRDYVTVLGGLAGWAVFGTTLAVVFRSAPLALGVGFAWAGPFENITVDSWATGYRIFPGQVLGSLIQGGTAELALGRSVLMAAGYCALALVVTLHLVSRRDVTA